MYVMRVTLLLFVLALSSHVLVTVTDAFQLSSTPSSLPARRAPFVKPGRTLLLYNGSSRDDDDGGDNKQEGEASNMKRPLLDRWLASTLFSLETKRVEASSEVDNAGRVGEPMAWSESTSLANKVSEAVATNGLGARFKQAVADLVAGDYDEEQVRDTVQQFVANDTVPVTMFSFTTCPFCRRAKDLLEDRGVPYAVLELDELDGNGGNEIRAVLGKVTGRTSVPSLFVRGTFIGGCNDGNPGLVPLLESGGLDAMLGTK